MQNLGLPPNTQPAPYVTDISGAETDGTLINMWLSGRPANTVRAYQSDINRFRCHVVKPLRQVTAADLINYAETLAKLAAATQHRRLSSIKSLFSYSHRLGYISLDPAAALRLPKPGDRRVSKLLSVEAVHAVINAAQPARDRLICRTLYLLGLREAELVRLNASDIQATPKGRVLAVNGKGDKQRAIALPPALAADLVAHRDSGAIFQSIRKRPLSASDIYRIVRQAGEKAGYRVTPHALRHCCASHALDAGAPIHVVKATLGHSSLSTTSIYVHSRPEDSAGMYLSDANNSAQNGNKSHPDGPIRKTHVLEHDGTD